MGPTFPLSGTNLVPLVGLIEFGAIISEEPGDVPIRRLYDKPSLGVKSSIAVSQEKVTRVPFLDMVGFAGIEGAVFPLYAP